MLKNLGIDLNDYVNHNGSHGAYAALHNMDPIWDSQVALGEDPLTILTADVADCVETLCQVVMDAYRQAGKADPTDPIRMIRVVVTTVLQAETIREDTDD